MKTKKAFINLITDVIPLIIVSILGIFKFKLFIQTLGDETLGLYPLFQEKALFTRRAVRRMPASSYRWNGVGYWETIFSNCSLVTNGIFLDIHITFL